jgi:hypothetical protein
VLVRTASTNLLRPIPHRARPSLSANHIQVVVDHFLHCGADVSFLSCFPEENEWLFPPNTYLLPSEYDAAEGGVGGVVLETITTPSGGVLEVVEVKPSF